MAPTDEAMTTSATQALNITFVIPYFYPAWEYGGQPRSAYELARALVQRGHHVKVLTTDSAGHSRLSAGHRQVDGIDVIYYRNLSNWLAFRKRFFWPQALWQEIAFSIEWFGNPPHSRAAFDPFHIRVPRGKDPEGSLCALHARRFETSWQERREDRFRRILGKQNFCAMQRRCWRFPRPKKKMRER